MKRKLNKRVMLLSVVALTVALFQFSTWLQSPAAHAQDGRLAVFTASQVFGLAQEQTARFCVGTVTSRGPALDWSIRISDERGNLLVQLPEQHSPAGEWRCVDAPRTSINLPGEPGTGRVQVAARHLVKAPLGTKPSDIIGSFEIVNGDGTAGAVSAVLYAAFHNND